MMLLPYLVPPPVVQQIRAEAELQTFLELHYPSCWINVLDPLDAYSLVGTAGAAVDGSGLRTARQFLALTGGAFLAPSGKSRRLLRFGSGWPGQRFPGRAVVLVRASSSFVSPKVRASGFGAP